MSLFDPYSHTRLQELRQEQLARKARHPGLEGALGTTGRPSIVQTVRALTARLSHPRGGFTRAGRNAGRPALDS